MSHSLHAYYDHYDMYRQSLAKTTLTAESVVYCNVVINLDEFNMAILPRGCVCVFLTHPSFLLRQPGTFALVKLPTLRW